MCRNKQKNFLISSLHYVSSHSPLPQLVPHFNTTVASLVVARDPSSFFFLLFFLWWPFHACLNAWFNSSHIHVPSKRCRWYSTDHSFWSSLILFERKSIQDRPKMETILFDCFLISRFPLSIEFVSAKCSKTADCLLISSLRSTTAAFHPFSNGRRSNLSLRDVRSSLTGTTPNTKKVCYSFSNFFWRVSVARRSLVRATVQVYNRVCARYP